MMKPLLAVMLVFSVMSCVSRAKYEDAKPEAQDIYVQTGGFVSKKCSKTKEVLAEQQRTMFQSEATAISSADNKLKNLTFGASGNVAVIIETKKFMRSGWNPFANDLLSELSYKAVIYSCPANAVQAMKNKDQSQGGEMLSHKELVTSESGSWLDPLSNAG